MQTQRNWVPRDQNKVQNSSASNNSLTPDEKLSIMEALDHMYVIRQYQDVGSCAMCKKISSKKCSTCGTYYCSSECQTVDWPKHRLKCSKQSDSISEVNSFSSFKQMRVTPSERNVNADDKMLPMITSRDSPFTALAKQVNKTESGKAFNDPKTIASFKIGNAQYRSNENMSMQLTNGLKDYKKINPCEQGKKSPRKPSSIKRSPTNTIRTSKNCSVRGTTLGSGTSTTLKAVENNSCNNGDTSSWKCQQTPYKVGMVGRTKVIGTYRESPNRYWVMALDNVEKYEEIQSVLSKECENYDSIFPKVGFVYGCTYSDEWQVTWLEMESRSRCSYIKKFRGKIVSMTPETSVHFIDFGNTSKYTLKVFKKLPHHLRIVPALSFLIEFEEGTPSQYKTADLDSEKFTIEETGRTPDGAIRVKIVEGIYGATRSLEEGSKNGSKGTKTNSSRRSALDSLMINSTGMLLFVPGEGTTRFASIIPENHNEVNECLEKILNIDCSKSKSFEAAQGDYVLVTDKEGNNQRGKVISKYGSSYCVQLIDCGNAISTDIVYPMPEDLKNLIELGVKVTVEKVFLEEEMKQESSYFTVEREAASGEWSCILRNQDRKVIANVLLQNPEENCHPETVHLKSGSTVEISCTSSPNSIYVRSVDAELEQKFLAMNMEMMEFAPKAKHCPVPPLPGELCCAKFAEDNCFYRATVISFNGGKVKVLFVDFGNEQETDLRDIKPIPESFNKVPFFAVKVTLKNVSPKPWNNMIEEYIAKLTTENIELTLTYKESIQNGVILKEKVSGIVVNEFIEKARTKSITSDSRKKDIFLDDDLTYTTPPSGGICSLAILYINEREFEASQTFWATIAEVENFNYVNAELSTLMCKYCESVSKPYRPAYRELCLAEYEGSWYRAMCAGNEGDIYKVFFVDFGNACELKAESIREMKEEFVSAPALAMNCILHGHEKLKGKPELVSKVYEILLDRINTCINGATVTKFENDTFLIKIPEIESLLLR